MTNLIRVLGRRLIALPIMILGATLLVFIVMSLSTADPARLALGEAASPEALEAYRTERGLNDPMLVRYLRYLGSLVRGDLGETFTGVPIAEMVSRAFPITLQLTFLGVALAVIFATVLGVLAALYRDRWPDQAVRIISIASLATPSFWLALLLIQWLGNIPGGAGLFPAVITDWVRFSDDPAGRERGGERQQAIERGVEIEQAIRRHRSPPRASRRICRRASPAGGRPRSPSRGRAPSPCRRR